MNRTVFFQITFSLVFELAIFSTVLLCFAAIFVAIFRSKSAALRHQIWITALVGTLIFPVIGPVLPRLVPIKQTVHIQSKSEVTQIVQPVIETKIETSLNLSRSVFVQKQRKRLRLR